MDGEFHNTGAASLQERCGRCSTSLDRKCTQCRSGGVGKTVRSGSSFRHIYITRKSLEQQHSNTHIAKTQTPTLKHRYTWGWGDRGQLGLSDWENQTRPKLVKTVDHAPRHAPKVGSGSFLLGDTMLLSSSSAMLRPVDATVYVKFASISCGQDHCVAVSSEGQVFTWGSNSRGQLGLGDSENRFRPTLVRTMRRQVRDAQCGAMHTVCLMTGGSVYAWGAGVSSSSSSSSRTVDDTRRALAILPDMGRMSLNELKKHLRGLDPRRAKIIEKNVYELSSTEARKVMHEILRDTLAGSGGRKAKDAFYPVGLKFDSKSCIGQISIGWSVGVALCNSGAVYVVFEREARNLTISLKY